MKPDSTVKLACDFRQSNRLSPNEPISLKSLLFKLDIITVFTPLSHKFSGMSIKTDDGFKFILINSKHSVARQNFTICHEFYHIYFQENFTSMLCSVESFDKRNKIEYRADCFAADLLIPEFSVIDLIPNSERYVADSISLRTLLSIEHYCSCSRTALLFRLKKMSWITNKFYDKFSKDVKKGALENGYSMDLYEPSNQKFEIIGRYGEIVRSKFEQGLLSETKYISLLQDIGIDLDSLINKHVED